MVDLVMAATGAAQSEDFAISIMNHLKNSWANGPAVSVAVGSIVFDTKFSDLSKDNAVAVKPMTRTQKYGQLGPSRRTFSQFYKIHVWCAGHSGKNNKYIIEKEIERIIGADPLALRASKGIEEMELEEFEEVETGMPEEGLNEGYAVDERTVARSKATVCCHYDKLVV